jgi:hypothetical protein
MPTNATGSGGLQLTGSAGAALYGPALITVTRLLDNLNNRLLTSAETTTCADLINAVSAAIRRYCRADFPTPNGVVTRARGCLQSKLPWVARHQENPNPTGLLGSLPLAERLYR